MSGQLIDKLLESFNELDKCIEHTRDILKQKEGVPVDVLSRIDQYTQIVTKQRNLASELRNYIEKQEWDNVSRHVKLINGLSSMIKEDAQAILSGDVNVFLNAKPQVLL